ncbi:MAG: methionine--tRNA ligase [Deltaproteobacteria bacterium]|nr:methionine--tRNA ligase [Deltaproteobacteria bacterium]
MTTSNQTRVNVSKGKKFLITAGLPYSNGRLHVGHIAGAYLPADIFSRYLRLSGADVRAICGSDDYGVAIMVTADKEGKTPAEIAEYYNQSHKNALAGLNIDFDIYSATSRNPYHKPTTQEFFLTLSNKGYLKKGSTNQFYDPMKEMFLPDRYVKGRCQYCNSLDQNGDQCEHCGNLLDTNTLLDPVSTVSNSPALVKSTAHWFFDLSIFEQNIRSWLDTALIRPNTKSYVEGLFSTGLVTRAMTRDINWGIPVPLEDPDAQNKVIYVWFDAPIGYISNTKELCSIQDSNPDTYTDWWKSSNCEIYHFIGEDNTIFHSIIWIAMLSAEGSFNLPNGVIVNSFLNIKFPTHDVEKISKSRGSAIWIDEFLLLGYGPDALRYYLTAISPEQTRSIYKPDDLITRYHSELGNALGNLVSRTLSMTQKYIGSYVPDIGDSYANEQDLIFSQLTKKIHQEVTELIESFCFRQAQDRIFEFVRECNKYLDNKAPWKTAKSDISITQVTLFYCLSAIKNIAVLLLPFLPTTAEKILAQFQIDSKTVCWKDALTDLSPLSYVGEPIILFPRIEEKVEPLGPNK